MIATPGRLIDLLENGKTNLRRVTYLVSRVTLGLAFIFCSVNKICYFLFRGERGREGGRTRRNTSSKPSPIFLRAVVFMFFLPDVIGVISGLVSNQVLSIYSFCSCFFRAYFFCIFALWATTDSAPTVLYLVLIGGHRLVYFILFSSEHEMCPRARLRWW